MIITNHDEGFEYFTVVFKENMITTFYNYVIFLYCGIIIKS